MTSLRKKLLKTTLVILTFFIGFNLTQFTFSIINPAVTYCQSLGYQWSMEETERGEIGVCKFPDGTSAEDWDFLKGKSGQEWSYCKKKGYEFKTVSDINKCSSIFSEDCAVCVLKEGVEIEASKLLGFEKERESCGNKLCESGENLQNCPQDCLAKKKTLWLYIGILFIVIILGIFIYIGTKKWREKKNNKINA